MSSDISRYLPSSCTKTHMPPNQRAGSTVLHLRWGARYGISNAPLLSVSSLATPNVTHSFSKVIFREEEKKMENTHVPFYITSSCSEHYDSFTRKTSVKVKFFSQWTQRELPFAQLRLLPCYLMPPDIQVFLFKALKMETVNSVVSLATAVLYNTFFQFFPVTYVAKKTQSKSQR